MHAHMHAHSHPRTHACTISHCTAPQPNPPGQDHLADLGRDVDIGKYVASGIVVFDLHRRYIKWSQVRL